MVGYYRFDTLKGGGGRVGHVMVTQQGEGRSYRKSKGWTEGYGRYGEGEDVRVLRSVLR